MIQWLHSDLIQTGIFIVALVGLCYTIVNFCHTYTSLVCSVGADVKIVSQILAYIYNGSMDTYTHLTENKKLQQEEVVQTIKIS